MKVLYINSYIREHSRTKILADYLVNKIGGNVKEIELSKEKIIQSCIYWREKDIERLLGMKKLQF